MEVTKRAKFIQGSFGNWEDIGLQRQHFQNALTALPYHPRARKAVIRLSA
jgi:hypothetical protein